VKLYSFDEGSETLDLLPLAARRALDRAGLHLSLAGWRSLGLGERRTLAGLGSQPEVDVAAVAACVAAAEPAVRAEPVREDPPAAAPPPAVSEAFAEMGPLGVRVWSGLEPLDRYALDKLARSGRAERLQAGYDEIVGHTRVSTHVEAAGGVRMVRVGNKDVTSRRAEAESRVSMQRAAFELLVAHAVPKGDVLSTARIAGIMAAKRTADLIPLCHPLSLSHVAIDLSLNAEACAVEIVARVETRGRTGVEMEALVAASCAALTVYDMLKSSDRSMQIGPTRLLAKSGGASGDYSR
jgi:cyclic pyranopterin phosphate synthase